MRLLFLFLILATLSACTETPSSGQADAVRLGLDLSSVERDSWGNGCGKNMAGGTFRGTLSGRDVTGHWCCNSRQRCFYSVD